MELNAYQDKIKGLMQYPNVGSNLLYPALGLTGESGEVADKIKKLWRNSDKTAGKQLTGEESDALVKEMGDVLWYLAALATELNVTLGTVAIVNLTKLLDRQARGVIKSQGDNR